MNKIILYVGLAILLGTVTMVVPLTLLGTSESIPEGNYTVRFNDTETSRQASDSLNGGKFESDNKSPTPEPTNPEAPQIVLSLTKTETASDLSTIGLMTIPSFLVALGVFVYLRKRMS